MAAGETAQREPLHVLEPTHGYGDVPAAGKAQA